MARIIAIDQGSTKCGFAIMEDGNIIDSGVIKAKGKDRVDRYRQILADLIDIVCDTPCTVMAIEDVFLKRSGFSNPVTSKIMGETRGIIMSVGLTYNMQIISINPSALTKFLGVNTRKDDKKSVTMAYVAKLLGREVLEDEADAVIIAYIANNEGKHANVDQEVRTNTRRQGQRNLRSEDQVKEKRQRRKTNK